MKYRRRVHVKALHPLSMSRISMQVRYITRMGGWDGGKGEGGIRAHYAEEEWLSQRENLDA